MSNVVATFAFRGDTFVVLRDPVSTHLFRWGSSRVVPKELRSIFKTADQAIAAVSHYLSSDY